MTQKVLVLAAHPDDETLGCGGTIARLASEGAYIKLITFTDGESARGQTTKNRNDKLASVCTKLGITDYAFSNYPDNRLDIISLLDKCKYVEQNVDFEPNLIFTHHPHCLNIDHEIIYRTTITVFRPQTKKEQTILSYTIPSSTDYNPRSNFCGNVYYDVSSTYNIKLECLKENYADELRVHPHSRSIENIENLMKVAGAEIGVSYAEKFEFIRSIK
ncbi:MAG TPA: PIG-L family deacetylase [Flavobacteriales bacterium]|nr:PIG-L family deacetylase [Flavobacteriales bacterium]